MGLRELQLRPAPCSPCGMTKKLEHALKREIDIDGTLYTLTITPEGLKLVAKGHRKGLELEWRTIVNGDAALVRGLQASVAQLAAADAATTRARNAGK